MAASTPLSPDEAPEDDPEQTMAILDALGDEVSREILVAGMERAVTAEELASRCSVSESTIYRRLDRLSELGLVERCNHLVAESDAKSAYRTPVDGLTVKLDQEGLRVEPEPDDPLSSAIETVLGAVDLQHVNYEAESNDVDVRFSLDDDQVKAFASLFGELSRA
jgi:DNA-binding transcriptional ArsR family regulator